jgi:hypothetical protein
MIEESGGRTANAAAMKRLIVAVLAAALLLPSAGSAADVSFSGHDIADLLMAVHNVDTSDNILLNVMSKAPADMPIYDPFAHYAGLVPSGKPGEATLWLVKNIDMKNRAAGPAFRAAMELACMDTGDAGSKWKAIYDAAAAADANLSASQADRYFNRHMLTTAIQTAVDNVEKASASPSPAP